MKPKLPVPYPSRIRLIPFFDTPVLLVRVSRFQVPGLVTNVPLA